MPALWEKGFHLKKGLGVAAAVGASIRDAFCTKQVTVFMRARAPDAVAFLLGAEDEYPNSQ